MDKECEELRRLYRGKKSERLVILSQLTKSNLINHNCNVSSYCSVANCDVCQSFPERPDHPKSRIGEVSTPAVLADLPYLAHQQPNVLDYWKAGFWVF